MELFDVIQKRCSYRGDFTSAPVPREDLQKIVQAGIQSPSACNAQVASFVIVDDPKTLRQIADILERPFCYTAKAMIVCITDPRPVYQTMSFDVEDCSAAVANMLLAVTALGYSTVWLDGVLRAGGRAEQIGGLLGVPSQYTVRILLPIGMAAEPGQQRERLPFDQRAWFNHYGAKK